MTGITGRTIVLRVCVLLLVVVGAARAEIIDRIMAVVAGRVILLSDVRAFRELLLDPAAGSADETAVRALIDRELMLLEVDRYALAAPDGAAVETFVSQIHARVGPEKFDEALRLAGWTPLHVHRVARDNLRIGQYLEERFTAAATPTDAEVLEYYREGRAEFTRDGPSQPFEAVQEIVRAQLSAERRLQLIADWVAELRRRADVTTLGGA